MSCYRVVDGAVILTVRLTPRADRDAVGPVAVLSDGVAVARVRVRAPPEAGAANRALVAVLARTLKRPGSAVHIVRGASHRVKQVRIEGDPAVLAAVIDGWEAP